MNQFLKTLVILHLVDQTLVVTMGLVHVYLNLMVTPMLVVDQNVFLVKTVAVTRLACARNVLILAQELVDKMLDVKL